MLERVVPGSICAELGTFRGEFAQTILRVCRPALLYVVDTFDGIIQSGGVDGLHMETEDMGAMFSTLATEFHGRPVELVRAVSWDWLASLRPGSLDFVYIDTDHNYNSTWHELEAAKIAVGSGGLICGHDYHAQLFPGVFNAVNAFAKAHGLFIEIYAGDRLASYLMVNK